MASPPLWYGQLIFSHPEPVSRLRVTRAIPDLPGCYVFTESPGPLVPGQVLYVGKANRLKSRLGGYLVDYMQTTPTRHKGRAFIFEHRHRFGDQRLFVRWTIYGDPASLEGSLIAYLNPAMNDRDELPGLADDEALDPRSSP